VDHQDHETPQEPVADEPEPAVPVRDAEPPAAPAPEGTPPQILERPGGRRLAIVTGIAGLLVGALVASGLWLVHPSGPRAATAVPSPAPPPTGACTWKPVSGQDRKDVGTPSAADERHSGTATMTLATNLGTITIAMDAAKTPCAVASFGHLASRHFFDNSTCHRLFARGEGGILQCGDPTGTGQGGPTYGFASENLASLPTRIPSRKPFVADTEVPEDIASLLSHCPSLVKEKVSTCVLTFAPLSSVCPGCTFAPGGPFQPAPSPSPAPYYPRGTVALVNTGPGTSGSQFFFVYRDTPLPPEYTPFGTVTAGLDILDTVAKAGDDGAYDPSPGGGHPNRKLTIQSLATSVG
jgi:cyclophilin family peptidyl-prolyl cis-trans isomerase